MHNAYYKNHQTWKIYFKKMHTQPNTFIMIIKSNTTTIFQEFNFTFRI